jgi:hypothetical protein
MNSVFSKIDMHQGLGRAIAHIGQQRFWQPYRGGVLRSKRYTASTCRILRSPHGAVISMRTYLNGVYLFGPEAKGLFLTWRASF